MALTLFNFQGLFDMAGAGAPVSMLNAFVLNEATYQDIELMTQCMESKSLSESQIYNQYLNLRGKSFGHLNSAKPTQRAIIRICCHLRYHNIDEAQKVIQAWEKLDESVQKNLEKEMAVTGKDTFVLKN